MVVLSVSLIANNTNGIRNNRMLPIKDKIDVKWNYWQDGEHVEGFARDTIEYVVAIEASATRGDQLIQNLMEFTSKL